MVDLSFSILSDLLKLHIASLKKKTNISGVKNVSASKDNPDYRKLLKTFEDYRRLSQTI